MASAAENEAIVHTSPQICDVEMLPVLESSSLHLLSPLIVQEHMTTRSHDAAVLDQEFVVPFPDPASTLDIHGSATSHQGVQVTSSSVNHSEPTNISYGGSTTLNTPLANNHPTMGHNPPRHLFNDPYEYELEKIRIEEDNLKKSLEETISQLMAELDKEMAEARSEFDRESQELDAKVMEVEANMGLVRTGSLLANAFVSKCSERSASNDLAAVRAMISQHSTQQQQAVQTNTQMSSTAPPRVRPQQASTRVGTSAPPRPSVIAVDDDPVPNSSGPLLHLQRRTTTLPSPISQQAAHTHVNSTAPPPPSPPSVTSVEPQTPNNNLRPLVRFPPRTTTTQPSPMSQQASNTNVNSTALLPRPSVTTTEALPRTSVTTTEVLPLHSPLSNNTPRPRPRPVISNLTPSSSSSPPVRGPAPHIMRASAPHLTRRQAPPHLRQYGSSPAPMSAAATTHPTSSVQEQEKQQQQQGKSNGGLVHLSDED